MPQSANAVQVSTAVSAFASGYSNAAFIADAMCPVIEHGSIEGTFFSKTRADVGADYEDALGPSSEPDFVDYTVNENTFIVKGRGLMGYVPYAVLDNAADVLAPREGTARDVLQKLKLKQERRVSTLLQTAGNYAASNTGAAAAVWTNTATSTPIKDIQTAIAKVSPGDTGLTKLVMGLGLEAWQALSRHPDILGLRGGGALQAGVAAPMEIAGYLGLDEILVSDAEYNTAAKAATASFSRVWDTTKAAIVRVPKSPPTMVENLQMFACQFRWSGANGFAWEAVEWDEPKRGPGKGSLAIKISHWTTEKVIQNDMGYLLTSVT